jgi:nitroreductase
MPLEALRRVEWIARRAPSAHNTQPWRLVYGDDAVRLDFDPDRALPASDPTRRDLYLSMGAFAESMLILANEAGAPLRFEADVCCDRIGWFWPGQTAYPTPFNRRDLIARRVSRLKYAPFAFDAESQACVQDWAGAGERLVFVRGEELIDLAGQADAHFFASPGATGEFLRWFRREEDAHAQDGLSTACLGLSRREAALLAWLLSPRVYPWMRRLGGAHVLARASGVIDKTTRLIALVGEGEAPEDIVLSGRALMRVWLGLARMGLYAHPLSQILDCAATERRLSLRLGLVGAERLRCLFRFGPSPEPPRSKRLGETLRAVSHCEAAAMPGMQRCSPS